MAASLAIIEWQTMVMGLRNAFDFTLPA